MCQAYEAEAAYVGASEKEEIYRRYEAFQRGEIHLSDDDLKDMVVRMLMLRDAGY